MDSQYLHSCMTLQSRQLPRCQQHKSSVIAHVPLRRWPEDCFARDYWPECMTEIQGTYLGANHKFYHWTRESIRRVRRSGLNEKRGPFQVLHDGDYRATEYHLV